MPENVKKCAENAAKAISNVTNDKRAIATVIAESFAAGLATGVDLAESKADGNGGE